MMGSTGVIWYQSNFFLVLADGAGKSVVLAILLRPLKNAMPGV